MAAGLTLTSPGSITQGLCASSSSAATTFSRGLTLMTRVTTRLENASCVIGNSAKEPPTRMRTNTLRPMPRLVMPHVQAVRPCHHLWGKHNPS
jgi:hypothetical protein